MKIEFNVHFKIIPGDRRQLTMRVLYWLAAWLALVDIVLYIITFTMWNPSSHTFFTSRADDILHQMIQEARKSRLEEDS